MCHQIINDILIKKQIQHIYPGVLGNLAKSQMASSDKILKVDQSYMTYYTIIQCFQSNDHTVVVHIDLPSETTSGSWAAEVQATITQ